MNLQQSSNARYPQESTKRASRLASPFDFEMDFWKTNLKALKSYLEEEEEKSNGG